MRTSPIGTRVAILHIAQYSLPEISSGYTRSVPELIRGHSRQVQSGTCPLAWLIDEVPEGSRTTEVRSDECRRPRQARHCGTR